MSIEVISVHFPKSGGSSLCQSLMDIYGENAVYRDYADDPVDPNSHYSLDPDGCWRKTQKIGFASSIKVIHGHFHPLKYKFIKNAKKITFLQHPVDNLISIYYFWKKFQGQKHSVLNYFLDNQLTIPDLACIPSIRCLLSRTYFGNIDMRSFDFIGFQENFSEDLCALSEILYVPLIEHKENVNHNPVYREEIYALKTDKHLMATLHNCLYEDINFYENAKAIRRNKQGRGAS